LERRPARRRNVARALVIRALGYLRSIGCTKAVLHPSDAGGLFIDRSDLNQRPKCGSIYDATIQLSGLCISSGHTDGAASVDAVREP
jgi:hypothetical protein